MYPKASRSAIVRVGGQRGRLGVQPRSDELGRCEDDLTGASSGVRFTIRTDKPNVKVSWQVTAKRNDPYMREHPFQAEQAKTGLEQGRYVTPQAYGKTDADSIMKTPPAPPKPPVAAGASQPLAAPRAH
jgi:hypothetical protein